MDRLQWDTKTIRSSYGTSVWKGVNKRLEKFKNGLRVRHKVGNGNRTRFWKDHWIGEVALEISFTNLFRVSRKKEVVVSKFYAFHEGTLSWNLDLRRRLTDVEILEAVRLTALLDTVVISESEDSRVWKHTKDGIFTVKSCYDALSTKNLADFPYRAVWNSKVPTKISFFIWLVHHNSILTQDVLMGRGRPMANRCIMCKLEAETTNHLLLHCPVATKIWNFFYDAFGVYWAQGEAVQMVFLEKKTKIFSTKGNFMWDVLPFAICWCIWKERNSRTFEGKELKTDRIIQEIKATILYWAIPFKALEGIHFEDLMCRWEVVVRDRGDRVRLGFLVYTLALMQRLLCFFFLSVILYSFILLNLYLSIFADKKKKKIKTKW